MDMAELEQRIRTLEERQEFNKKKGNERRAKKENERNVYRSLSVRFLALLVAYPVVSLFYEWVLELSSPWLRGLIHVATIGIFVLVTRLLQYAVLRFNSKEDRESDDFL